MADKPLDNRSFSPNRLEINHFNDKIASKDLFSHVDSRRMAILAECDICGNQHRVKDGLVGSSIRCDDCGVKIVVPKDQFITPDTFIEVGGRLRRREPESQTSVWTTLVAILVTVIVLAILLITVWAALSLTRFGSAPMRDLSQKRPSANAPSLASAIHCFGAMDPA